MPTGPPPSVSVPGRPPRAFGPGHVVPALLLAACLADGATRLVPPERFAFRAWELMTLQPAPGGPFAADARVEIARCWGDLSNIGNYPEDRVLHRERFSTDALGFRRSDGVVPGRPVSAILFGDSIAAGSGVSDDETLSSRLHALTGKAVYDAGGRPYGSVPRIREIARRAGLRDGIVLWEVNARSGLQAFSRASMRTPVRGEEIPAAEQASVAPLTVLAHRAILRLEALAGARDDRVRREMLTSGESMLFWAAELERPVPEHRERLAGWRELSEELARDGHRLVAVVVPAKSAVYARFLESRPAGGNAEDFSTCIAAELEAEGIPSVDLLDPLVAAARKGLPEKHYVFSRDDTHLTAEGIDVAARAVKGRLSW